MQAVGEVSWAEQESGINNIIAAAGSARLTSSYLWKRCKRKQSIKVSIQETARKLVQQSALGAAEMVVANPDRIIHTA